MATSAARTRTFDGCETCRRRHVRCDTTRPACLRCSKLGLICGGYEKIAVFGSGSQQTARFRRPISTEQERQHMSENLVNRVGLCSAIRYIREIEQDCDEGLPASEVEISRGPFTVFSARPSTDHDLSKVEELDINTENVLRQDDITLLGAGQSSPTTEALIAAMSGQSDLFDFASFEHGSGTPADGRVEELFDLDSVPERLDIAASPGMSFWQDDSLANVGSPLPQIASPPMPITTPTLYSSDAIHLLSHYTNTVVSLLTPFRHTKTPWHILLIPHVKSCLAAIALNEELDHASLCVFHGTLAMSALSLHGLSSEGPWGERSELHRHQAQQHAKLTIKAAYDIPKKAKYKTILMALITMIQVCVFSAKDPGSYFVEAEKFIRLKGLKRRKSRKVRLLHHCYVFERMFYESTSVTAADPDEQIALSRTVASSGIVVYGQDSPGFRLPDLSNLDASLQRVKDQAEGENDLHLAYPGDFPATMYPEVVAVPEIYMVLLSVIVRLGKAKDTNGVLPSDFLTQAKNLERAILRSSPATRDCRGGISSNAANENVLRDMRLAMHEALLLYFYRRIYDVDASLLQGRARLICECLLRCEAADSQSLYGSTGFRWPAFIAACETEELDVQQSFTLLFRRLAQRSGLSMFTSTLQDIQQVWSEKQKRDPVSVSWLDIMKRRPNPLTWANLTA